MHNKVNDLMDFNDLNMLVKNIVLTNLQKDLVVFHY